MEPVETERPDVDDLVARSKETVRERYRAGDYPPDLEPELADHFAAVQAAARPLDPRMSALLLGVEDASDFRLSRIPTGSPMPMGAQIHRVVAKLTKRQVSGLINQMRIYAASMHELVLELIERSPANGAAGPAGVSFNGSGRVSLAELLRAPREQVLESRRALVVHLAGHAPVLELGCGRGETLELLRAEGVECTGFEADADLLAECVRLGLPGRPGDGLEELARLGDGTLGGVVASGVVESMRPARLVELMAIAARRLRTGGCLVVEGTDPRAHEAAARAVYLGGRPVPAGLLASVARGAGFATVVALPGPALPDERGLEPLAASAGLTPEALAAYNRNVERLNRALFGPPTYVLVATR
jgi:SAM-dependent methyltransferase